MRAKKVANRLGARRASPKPYIRWEPSSGGTGLRGWGAGQSAYLLRRAGGGQWSLHFEGHQYGPFASLARAKKEAETIEGENAPFSLPSVFNIDSGDKSLVLATEPQHGAENLQLDHEHGEEWVTCRRCGRQWAIRGTDAEQVSEGDGHCDENPED